MKSLIKKVLLEYDEKKSKEERIQDIINKKEYIIKIIHLIIKFFELEYGENLESIRTREKPVTLGYEMFTIDVIEMNFYFNDPPNNVYHNVVRDLKNHFDIDVEKYGTPLRVQLFRKKWEQI